MENQSRKSNKDSELISSSKSNKNNWYTEKNEGKRHTGLEAEEICFSERNSQAFTSHCENNPPPLFSFSKLWFYTGPGWLMSIAYLDPGNIEADLLAGTNGGYGLIWTLILATLCGLIIQILSARIGIVTGRDLAILCRQQFPKFLSIILWVMAEIAIIGSDIQEVIGTAIAFKILFDFPIWLGAIITILDTFTFLYIHSCGVRKLEAFFAALILTMAVCFFANMIIVRPEASSLMKGFVPGIPSGSLGAMIGLIGSIIMPHNLYLHSALVLTRSVNIKDKAEVREANKYLSIEAAISLLISSLINLSVISTFAYYHLSDKAKEIHLENAHESLEASFGKASRIIWAIGLMAAGQSSTMTGTYAGQFVMQGFIKIQIKPYLRVLLTRSLAIVPSIIVAFVGNLDELDGYINILQAIQLPFALIPLLKFSFSSKIMGDFKNHKIIDIICVIISISLISLNMYGLIPKTPNVIMILLTCTIGIVYFIVILSIILTPIKDLAPLDVLDESVVNLDDHHSVGKSDENSNEIE